MTSPLEDIDFLARSEHRVDALRRFREGPADRGDLTVATEASKATISRLLNEFEDRNWVVRDGHEYELTDPGEFVAEEFLRLVGRMGTEHALRDVWQWFPTEYPGCTMSLFAEANIWKLGSESPYDPISRFVELYESAHTVRAISDHHPKPGYFEMFSKGLAAGMEHHVINSPALMEQILKGIYEVTGTPEVIREAVESGRFTRLAHDSIPTNDTILIFDDRMAVVCRDDNGVSQAMVDTDAPEAVAWAESVFEEFRSEARPVDTLERLEQLKQGT
jgi:predicted transcriptional regulator